MKSVFVGFLFFVFVFLIWFVGVRDGCACIGKGVYWAFFFFFFCTGARREGRRLCFLHLWWSRCEGGTVEMGMFVPCGN